MGKLLDELKRRKVFRVAAVYAVVAWVLIQVAETISSILALPVWTPALVTVLLGLGFIPALILAWAYEVTPEGIKPDAIVQPSPDLQATSAQPINYLILIVVIIVAGIQLTDRFSGTQIGTLEPGEGSQILDENIKVNLNLGAGERFLGNQIVHFDVSDDGTLLAYASFNDGVSSLRLKKMNQLASTLLAESTGAFIFNLQISPDNLSVLYFEGRSLKSAPLDGGPIVNLISSLGPPPSSAVWLNNEEIVFSDGITGGIRKVETFGSNVEVLLPATQNVRLQVSDVSQDKFVLYSESLVQNNSQVFRVNGYNIESGQSKVLIENAFNATYLPSGYILFARGNDIWASALNTDDFELEGPIVPIAIGVHTNLTPMRANYSISHSGRLIYFPEIVADTNFNTELVTINANGDTSALGLYSAVHRDPMFNNSGDKLIFRSNQPDESEDIWVYDFTRNSSNRITFDGLSRNPIWTIDDSAIIFENRQSAGLWTTDITGSGVVRNLFSTTSRVTPQDVTPDGEFVIYNVGGGQPWNVSMRSLTQPALEPIPLLTSPFNEGQVSISPNGRWMAYLSNETGSDEVYIRSFPDVNAMLPVRVSINGGREPRWTHNGNRLNYIQEETTRILYREFVNEDELIFGDELVFEEMFYVNTSDNPNYAMSPDGEIAVIVRNDAISSSGKIPINTILVNNIFAELALDLREN